MTDDARQIEREVRELLDAMDRQYGQPDFSVAVDSARSQLRKRWPKTRLTVDQSRGKKAA